MPVPGRARFSMPAILAPGCPGPVTPVALQIPCRDELVQVCPIYSVTGEMIAISNQYQRFCGNVADGDPYCEINPSDCCPGDGEGSSEGSGGSNDGGALWWCVRVQECTDPDCVDCDQPSGVECVQDVDGDFEQPGDSRCVQVSDTLWRKETALKSYFTEAACAAGCGGVPTTCCGTVHQNLCAVGSNQSLTPCADAVRINMAYDGVQDIPTDPGHQAGCDYHGIFPQSGPTWIGTGTVCGHPVELRVACGTGSLGGQCWYGRFRYLDNCFPPGTSLTNVLYYSQECIAGIIEVLSCGDGLPLHLRLFVPSWETCGSDPEVPPSLPSFIFDIIPGPCPGSDDPPTVTTDTSEICRTAPTITIAGTRFNTTTLLDNSISFNLGAVGHCIAATDTMLTVQFDTLPSVGVLTAIVTNKYGSSGPPAKQVATVKECCTAPVWTDTYTGADGTTAQVHTPDVSPGGTGYTPETGSGNLVIQSNKLVCTGGATTAGYTFDPGDPSTVTTIDFVLSGSPAGFVELCVNQRAIPSGGGLAYFVQAGLLGNGGTLVVIVEESSTGLTSSKPVTLTPGVTYTLSIINNGSLVSATINGVTASVATTNHADETHMALTASLQDVGQTITIDNLNVYSCTASSSSAGASCPTPGSDCPSSGELTLDEPCTYDIAAATQHWFKFSLQAGFTYSVHIVKNSGSLGTTTGFDGSACGLLSIDFAFSTYPNTGSWPVSGSNTLGFINVGSAPDLVTPGNYTITLTRV